jgi:hypothetical protein
MFTTIPIAVAMMLKTDDSYILHFTIIKQKTVLTETMMSEPNLEDYRSSGDRKPPYSYAALICMAMGANSNKMTLSAIYKWIRDNFLYYRNADPSWQVRKTFKFDKDYRDRY